MSDTYYTSLEQNRFAQCIRRSEKQLATANLAWYRARVGWFVDAPSSVVCAVLGRAHKWSITSVPSFNYFPYSMLPLMPFCIHPFRPHWRFTSLCISPRLTSLRFSSSFSLSATISLPRGDLTRGATSDALCCRRVVAAASIPRLSRFRLSCRRGSRGDSCLPDMHVSFGTKTHMARN